jgi:omega-6 fatty acid desaturase (delta-12 desaturase)
MADSIVSGAKGWAGRLGAYKKPDNRRATFELVVTVVPLAAVWFLMWALSGASPLLSLLLAPAAGALLVRLFMIQHDCGHGAFFSSRRTNDWTGRVLGVMTLTPYDFWRHSHALHHAGSGNLDRRGIGDIDTLTVDEYLARDRWGRMRYRLYRHPLVMFGIGPAYLFLLQHRLPLGAMGKGIMPWASTQLTNLGVIALVAGLAWLTGPSTFILVHVPMVIIGSAIGVWLFYIQHQFEGTYWERETQWSHSDSALHGSSFYDLPKVLMWVTGYIGVHHVHHLSSRIPFYRLPDVLAEHPEIRKIGRITLTESLGSVWLTLWDPERKMMVPFSALKPASLRAQN